MNAAKQVAMRKRDLKRALAMVALTLILAGCTKRTDPPDHLTLTGLNWRTLNAPTLSPAVLRNGVIPPEDYEVKVPFEDAYEAYSLASFLAQSCRRFAVDEGKLFRFFHRFELRPDDVQPGGQTYDAFRDTFDVLDGQFRRSDVRPNSCMIADRMHRAHAGNPGWVLKAV